MSTDFAPSLVAGDVFAGRYRIGSVLGTGGMGIVYEAVRVDTSEPVALKILHNHLVSNHQVFRRFHREASILGRMEGAHLVRLLDFGHDDAGRLFMALERVVGEPLDLVLLRRGPLSVAEAARIMMDVCDALIVAHGHGVIHRDLKPANVLLERTGPGQTRVKVFDFGLAKIVQSEDGPMTTALTEQNMIFGTPEYMSPEQVRGEEVDVRSDVYAAGVLLYELLTGTVPFAGPTGVATMTAHLNDEVILPSQRAPSRYISPALDEVVRHALAKHPGHRYPTVEALREALVKALASPHEPNLVRSVPAPSSKSDQAAFPDASATSSVRTLKNDPLQKTLPSAESMAPPRYGAVADSATARRLEPPSSRPGQVLPEQLAAPRVTTLPRLWVWLVVVAGALITGIVVGLLVSKAK